MLFFSKNKPTFFLFFFLILFGGTAISWFLYYQSHFLPNTKLFAVKLDSLNYTQAQHLLENTAQIEPNIPLILAYQDQQLASTSGQLGFYYDFDASLAQILAWQRSLSFFSLLQNFISPPTHSFNPVLNFNQTSFDNFLAIFDAQIYQSGRPSSITITGSGKNKKVLIDSGIDKVSLDYDSTSRVILDNFPRQTHFQALVKQTPLALSQAQGDQLLSQANNLLGKSITLTTTSIDNFNLNLSDNDLVSFLSPQESTVSAAKKKLLDQLVPLVSRSPQQPQLDLDNNLQVISFVQPLDGLTLDQDQFFSLFDTTLSQLINNPAKNIPLSLPLNTQKPTLALSDTNQLGINELIGFGESYYAHSIPGRIHNVALTANRINNTIVAPGAEFSFNRTLGEVSAATGFQPGYVIQGGRSVLADGGGVCQVSTTLFRALLDAGLKITLRRPHSYRVSYYELNNDPGFDATVYAGNVDLRFVNDSPNYILISAIPDSQNLYLSVKIYGTTDGRSTKISDYRKFNAVGAPPTQYIVDPSLPSGTKKQIDWAVGGLQTDFTHTVYNADGSIRSQKNYPSTYQPWSAKFLVSPE